MIGLKLRQKQCAMRMNNRVQAFHNSCSITTEYSCLLIEFVRPSDILNARPCINISQIDCLGGRDGRNTHTHCHAMYQLAFAFQCRSAPNTYTDEQNLCINRCPNLNDDLLLCGSNHSNQSDARYFICMNGTRINNARCNQKFACEYGEDEYWCSSHRLEPSSKGYRIWKQQDQMTAIKLIKWSLYPPRSRAKEAAADDEQKLLVKGDISVNAPPPVAALLCNRRVAVSHYTNRPICFCPPSYYGDYCEYHNDRITSNVHLDYSNSSYAHSPISNPFVIDQIDER